MIFMQERIVTIHSADEQGETPKMLRSESGLTQRGAVGLRNISSLPFLNQVEQDKATAQIDKVLHVCHRLDTELTLVLPESPNQPEVFSR